jgi:hypothetical protein
VDHDSSGPCTATSKSYCASSSSLSFCQSYIVNQQNPEGIIQLKPSRLGQFAPFPVPAHCITKEHSISRLISGAVWSKLLRKARKSELTGSRADPQWALFLMICKSYNAAVSTARIFITEWEERRIAQTVG